MRRLRAGLVTPLPGGLGSPSVPTTRDCPSVGWTRHGRRRAKARRIGSSQKPPGSAPGSYGPGDRNRRCGAPRGARAPQGARHGRKTAALRGAPPPFFERGTGRQATPGASTKNSGDDVCLLFDNCIWEKARSARQIHFPSPLVGEGGECGAIASTSRVRGWTRRLGLSPSPALASLGHPLPQRGEGKSRATSPSARPAPSARSA